MGFLENILKRKEIGVIVSPAAGEVISIRKVSDPTFGEEILGKGVAVIPKEGKFHAPADGTVTTVFPTGHAVAVTTDEGAEVLIHIGIDTVKLNGEHFRVLAQEGQKVKAGELLLEADLEQIQAAGYEIVTPVVICNSADYSDIGTETDREVAVGDTIIMLRK